MQHYRQIRDIHLNNTSLTIGSFDGVHLGHQKIIDDLTTDAHSIHSNAVVLTFDPHPAVVLGKRDKPFYLTTPDERAAIMGKMGVDVVVTLPFTRDIAESSADDFVSQLVKHLGLRNLYIGYNFALGRGREGGQDALRKLGEQFGFDTHVIPPIIIEEEAVSSSRIRHALVSGNVELANKLLGRYFLLPGRVIPGNSRGKSLGVPTANLDIWHERALPKNGVYVCFAHVAQEIYCAVTNIGIRPTFEQNIVKPRVETHLLDFNGDLYDRPISLEFISRLRDEKRFPDHQELVAQIRSDIVQAKQIFSVIQNL